MYRAIRVFAVLMLSLAGAAVGGGGVLTVTFVEPAANALTAAKDAAVVVHFDRPLNTGSVDASSLWAFGRWSGTATGSYSFSNSDQTVTLTPDDPFSAGEQVMVVLSHDLQAFDGSFLRGAGYSFQFWVRAAPSSLDFEPLVVVDTGSPSRPYGGIGSDLNGDGWLDLTTVNEDTSDLRVFLNTADGSGLVAADYLKPAPSTGNVPSPSEPSDFDRDGNVDVAAANTQGASVSILFGNGDGTFAPQQEVTVSAQPRGLAVLDVDGDGDVDVATANRSEHELSILRNDGSGVFGNVTTFGTGSAGEWALAAGDMDDDGILDLVAGGNADGRIYVYLSNGDGTFTLSDDVAAGGSPWMLMVGDLNGDGAADVSTANNTTGTIVLGDGAGNLGTPQTYGIDNFGLATDFGDLDGDGDLDWITASFNGDWLLFLNDGAGNFTFDREFPAPSAASCSLLLDLDNDGDLDLALIDELADQVVLLKNVGSIFTDGFESGDASRWTAATP
jgi:hypothetical protein